jgi:hypothetical protein
MLKETTEQQEAIPRLEHYLGYLLVVVEEGSVLLVALLVLLIFVQSGLEVTLELVEILVLERVHRMVLT